MAGWTVPGFEVDRLLGRGWGGELWSARGRATGRQLVLRRLVVAPAGATHDHVLRAAARLVGVTHPHLVGLRGVLSVEGDVVLVHDQVAGVGLEQMLAGHRGLTDAELVTLAAPLARALAAVHAQGLVHGRVSSSSVLVSDSGRPMLADAGVAALLDLDGRSTSTSDDVRDLALLCLSARDPAALAGPLVSVLNAAAAADAARRPSARELAVAVLASGPAAPIELRRGSDRSTRPPPLRSEATPVGRRRPHRHRRTSDWPSRQTSRRWSLLLAGLVAAAAAALTGLAWAGVDAGAPALIVTTPTATPRSSYAVATVAARWRSVLMALDARRASAFATARPERLRDVYAAGSPALAHDQARLADLVAAGLRVDRLRLQPRSVRVVSTASQRVVLEVVDVLEPYDVRTTRGALVEARPGRAAASWRVTLVQVGVGWRVYEVVAS